MGTYRVPVASGLVMAVFTFAMAIVGIFILSVVIDALAPSFGAEKNYSQALKIAVYSSLDLGKLESMKDVGVQK